MKEDVIKIAFFYNMSKTWYLKGYKFILIEKRDDILNFQVIRESNYGSVFVSCVILY